MDAPASASEAQLRLRVRLSSERITPVAETVGNVDKSQRTHRHCREERELRWKIEWGINHS